jgi:hypothetical protein
MGYADDPDHYWSDVVHFAAQHFRWRDSVQQTMLR